MRLLAVGPLALLASADPGGAQPPAISSVEALLEGFRAMPGFSARFEEEKQVDLLAVPLASSGELFFAPPALLVRRALRPTVSVLTIDADAVAFTDETGTERFDLGANPTARAFARTFADILAGDLPALQRRYEISFSPATAEGEAGAGAWRLELRPRDPALAKAISRIAVEGRGLVLREMRIFETSGDRTRTRFSEVDSRRRFAASELEQLKRLPEP